MKRALPTRDLRDWKLHGPVRAMRTELAEWDATREIWLPPRRVSSVMFRRDGQISEHESRNPDGSIVRWSRLYDPAGRITEESQTHTGDGLETRLTYAYDQQGRLTEKVALEHDGARRQVEACTYDGAGRKMTRTFLAAPNTHVVIDTHGVEGSDIAYGAPGAVTCSVTHDHHDLPSEATFHDADGAAIRRIVFVRDSDGRVLSETAPFGAKMAFGEQLALAVTYSYDANGRVVERIMRMGNLSEDHTTFQYDDFDNPTSEACESIRREIDVNDNGVATATQQETRVHYHRFDYIYDARGNWVERTVLSRIPPQEDFRRSNIERRTIEYYDEAAEDLE